eukprot:200432_1
MTHFCAILVVTLTAIHIAKAGTCYSDKPEWSWYCAKTFKGANVEKCEGNHQWGKNTIKCLWTHFQCRPKSGFESMVDDGICQYFPQVWKDEFACNLEKHICEWKSNNPYDDQQFDIQKTAPVTQKIEQDPAKMNQNDKIQWAHHTISSAFYKNGGTDIDR